MIVGGTLCTNMKIYTKFGIDKPYGIAVIAIIFAAFLIISVVVASTVNNRLGMIILIIGIALIFLYGNVWKPHPGIS